MSHLENEVSVYFYQLALIFPLFNHKTSVQWLAFKILCSFKNLKFALSSFGQKKKKSTKETAYVTPRRSCKFSFLRRAWKMRNILCCKHNSPTDPAFRSHPNKPFNNVQELYDNEHQRLRTITKYKVIKTIRGYLKVNKKNHNREIR